MRPKPGITLESTISGSLGQLTYDEYPRLHILLIQRNYTTNYIKDKMLIIYSVESYSARVGHSGQE